MVDLSPVHQVAYDALRSAKVDFRLHKMRDMNDTEAAIADRCSGYAAEWSSMQSPGRFTNGPRRGVLRPFFERRQEKRNVRECRRHIKKRLREDGIELREVGKHVELVALNPEGVEALSWMTGVSAPDTDGSDGVGFIFALISAVIFHLIVVLIVRAIVRNYIDNPSLCRAICQGR